ncbi:MAG TPA: N,N-dimethylformamidase beta subunit family domain-containing protein, partial [Pedococcus sp.]|nr:N,N-dimethylformamidase beta subunit family domain-containing protein [Pedococcus sp.]
PSPTSAAPSPSGPSSASTASAQADPEGTWVQVENRRAGTTAWRIPDGAVATDSQLAGWSDRTSVTPGETFGLHVSSHVGAFTVTAYRLGWYGGAGGREVWQSSPVPGRPGAAPAMARGRMVVTRWPTSLGVPTQGWPEGTYLMVLRAAGRARYVPVTVRSSDTTGRLVLVNAVSTWQAYNAWGGYSLYHGPGGASANRSLRVSYDRPYDGNGAQSLLNFEQAAIRAAERQGLDLAYLTSWDLDRDGAVLTGARGLVSLGHDEYWSPRMRAAVERARDLGTNLAFLGANAAYWRVRFEGGGRVLAGYKDAALDPVRWSRATTVHWREQPDPDPENSLTGMLYECYPATGALVVRTPGFFLFRGTGVSAGTRVPGLAGTEVDRAYPIAGTPANLQVVAHSPVRCGPLRRTWSDMTYYTTPSGAGVVSTGTMLWVRALRGPDASHGITAQGVAFVRTVTDTLLAAMAAGPMGLTDPSVPNLAGLHASPWTSTGTGAPYSLP